MGPAVCRWLPPLSASLPRAGIARAAFGARTGLAVIAFRTDTEYEIAFGRKVRVEALQLRDLTVRAGKATVWPPRWVESSGPGDPSARAEEGVLEGVVRLGRRLLLRINTHGRRRTASLEWDPPPGVGEVEAVLLASIGATVHALATREIPARTGGGAVVRPPSHRGSTK